VLVVLVVLLVQSKQMEPQAITQYSAQSLLLEVDGVLHLTMSLVLEVLVVVV
jgi:hypothetical protein